MAEPEIAGLAIIVTLSVKTRIGSVILSVQTSKFLAKDIECTTSVYL